MKNIEVDDELYHYIASKTEQIGEPASSILRRLLGFDPLVTQQTYCETASETVIEVPSEVNEPAAEPKYEDVAPAAKAEKPQKIRKPRKPGVRQRSADEEKESEEVAKLLPSEQLQALALDDLAMQHGAVGRFLFLLSALEHQHSSAFADVVKIKGRDRLYFADNEEALVQSGSSTNPKRIGGSSYWVITNNNTSRKKWMLTEVAKMLGYNNSDVRILANKI